MQLYFGRETVIKGVKKIAAKVIIPFGGLYCERLRRATKTAQRTVFSEQVSRRAMLVGYL